MIQDPLIRKKSSLVNTDVNRYHEAKARRNQEKYIRSLEDRINRLERTVEQLELSVTSCNRGQYE